jgi:hypothetical protein
VLAVLKEAGRPLSVNEIKAAADLQNRDAADKLLQRMAGAGEIRRFDRGKYGLSFTPLSEVSESPKVNKTPQNMGKNTASDSSDTSDTPLTGVRPDLGPPGDSLEDFQ